MKIIYAILIVISIIFYILFIEKLSFYLMIFIIALPIALGIILLIGKFNIKCNLSSKEQRYIKNEKCVFFLQIINKSIFPFPLSDIKIEYQNKISGIKGNMYISIPIHSHTNQTVSFSLSSDYCGIMNVKVKSIALYDYIKLFSSKVKTNANTEVYIIPDISSNINEYNLKTIFSDESERFSQVKSGDDPSEIFELKNYVPGDKMNRIHWNLSSRQNHFITKHYSQGISSPVTIIPDIDFNNLSLIEINAVLEIFYSLSFILTENQMIHNIYMPDTQEIAAVSEIEILNQCYVNILKNMNQSVMTSDDILSISENQAKVYLITNKSFDSYDTSENTSNGEINYIFVSSLFEQPDFIELDNIRISKLPADNVSYHIEKILL